MQAYMNIESYARNAYSGYLGNLFAFMRESPEWRIKHPTGPVHWDMKCERCGFEIADFTTNNQNTIKGNIAPTKDGITIVQRGSKYVLCTNCSPLS